MPSSEHAFQKIAALICLAVVLGFGLQWALPGQVLFFRDHLLIFSRLQHVLNFGSEFQPLWDASVGGGEALAAYPSALAYSPLRPLLWLGGGTTNTNGLFIFAHIVVAFLGGYIFLGELKITQLGRLWGALVHAMSGTFLAFNSLMPAFESFSFGALALGLALALVRKPTAALLGLWALVLAWHVQVADPAFLVCDVLIFAACVDWSALKQVRTVAALILGVGLAACVTAAQTLPLVDLLTHSQRGAGFSYEQLSFFSFHPWRLLEFLAPGLSYIDGRGLFSSIPDGRIYLPSAYWGAVSLPLLFVIRPGKTRVRLLVVLVACTLLAMGYFTPVHEWVVRIVPGLSSSRYPVKYLYGSSIAVCGLIGLAVSALGGDPALQFRRVKTLATPAVLVVCLGLALLSIQDSWLAPYVPAGAISIDDATTQVRGALSWGLLALLAGLALLWAWVKGWQWAPYVMLGLVGLDLAAATLPMFDTVDEDQLKPPPIVDLLQEDTGSPAVFLYSFYRALPTQASPRDNALYAHSRGVPSAGVPSGIRYIFDPDLNSTRPAGWTRLYDSFAQLTEPQRIRLLGRLGTTHILVETNGNQAPPGLTWAGSAPTVGGPPISALRLAERRSLVSVATKIRYSGSRQEALWAMTSTTVSLETVVWPFDAPPGPEIEATIPASTSEILQADEQPGHVAVKVRLPGRRLILLAQNYDIDWVAHVDGSPTKIFPVDLTLMAVEVPAGDHRVRFDYAPISFDAGVQISGLALLIVLGLLATGLRRQGALRITNSISSNPPT